jgi:hypothetical protein
VVIFTLIFSDLRDYNVLNSYTKQDVHLLTTIAGKTFVVYKAVTDYFKINFFMLINYIQRYVYLICHYYFRN